MRTMTRVAGVLAVLGLCWFLGGCGCGCDCEKSGLMKPRIGFMLPEKYNSPDGMTLGKDGCIYLSMNNVVLPQHPAMILRITPDDKLEEVVTLPPHPDTGRASPLGIAFGSDGNLYVADCQAFYTKEPAKSRLLRVNMKDGKAAGCDVVAVGFNMSNGVAAKDDCIYVCETTLNKETPMASGVYRFTAAELDAKNPAKVTGLNDPRLVIKLSTQNKDHLNGANGLDFDAAGNMYVCNFGDREVIKVTFDDAGKIKSQDVLAKDHGMESADGLHCDAAGNVWVADFLGNAVVRIDAKSGAVTVVAKNGESDGADGSFHAPSECIRRGSKLYVSNINLTYGPHKSSKL